MKAIALRVWMGKMRGEGKSPLKVLPKNAAFGALGGFVAIALLALLSEAVGPSWIMAPFGASCVLVFGLWDSPLSQPRSVIGGHMVSTAIGLAVYHTFGQSPFAMAAGVGLAIAAMMLTKTTHPPAGADPLVVILSGAGWSFLVEPVLIGALAIVAVALIANNMIKQRRYPTFWR